MFVKKIILSFILIFNVSILGKSLNPIELLSEFVGVDTINPPVGEELMRVYHHP